MIAGGSEPAETVGGVLADLAEVAERLPVGGSEEADQMARILDRLSEEVSEAATMLRGGGRRRTDGSIPAGDARINGARALLAERHEPLTMTPGDLRALLVRYHRRVEGLLQVIDHPATGLTAGTAAMVSRADLVTLSVAIGDAMEFRASGVGGVCADCQVSSPELCPDHVGDVATVQKYKVLGRALGWMAS